MLCDGGVSSGVFLPREGEDIAAEIRSLREARAAGYRAKVAKLPDIATPKAQALWFTHGMLKAVIGKDSSKILGVLLLCGSFQPDSKNAS